MSDELVPDDFDLDEARSKRSTTEYGDDDPRCPHCNSIKIQERIGYSDAKAPYYCDYCERSLEEEELNT